MERELIGSVQLNVTTTGKDVADLYSTDTRLQFPVLRLFDLSALTFIGLDPDTMGAERVHKRIWAYYTISGKINKDGNPYRDVHHLEPIEQSSPAEYRFPVPGRHWTGRGGEQRQGIGAAMSVDSDDLLGELRRIRASLADIHTLLDSIARRLRVSSSQVASAPFLSPSSSRSSPEELVAAQPPVTAQSASTQPATTQPATTQLSTSAQPSVVKGGMRQSASTPTAKPTPAFVSR